MYVSSITILSSLWLVLPAAALIRPNIDRVACGVDTFPGFNDVSPTIGIHLGYTGIDPSSGSICGSFNKVLGSQCGISGRVDCNTSPNTDGSLTVGISFASLSLSQPLGALDCAVSAFQNAIDLSIHPIVNLANCLVENTGSTTGSKRDNVYQPVYPRSGRPKPTTYKVLAAGTRMTFAVGKFLKVFVKNFILTVDSVAVDRTGGSGLTIQVSNDVVRNSLNGMAEVVANMLQSGITTVTLEGQSFSDTSGLASVRPSLWLGLPNRGGQNDQILQLGVAGFTKLINQMADTAAFNGVPTGGATIYEFNDQNGQRVLSATLRWLRPF